MSDAGVGSADLFSREELDALAVGTDARMRAVLAGGSAEEVLGTLDVIDMIWRGFALNIEAWGATLLRSWLVETHGLDQPPAPLRLVRAAELALRRDMSLEDVRLANELLETPRHPLRLALEAALAEQDRDAALAAWEYAARLMDFCRALVCDHVSDVLGFIHTTYGDEELERALVSCAERGTWPDALGAWATMEPRPLLEQSALFLTAGTGSVIHIEEEADRFAIDVLECHCSRQLADHQANGWELPVIQGPSPLTYGEPAMTPYQSHYGIIHGTWSIDRFGRPIPHQQCCGMRRADGETCRAYVYKDDTKIPAAVYAALGRPAPSGGAER